MSEKKGWELKVTGYRNKTYIHRRDAESAKKIILDINELSKRILGLSIAVRKVTIEKIVFLPFKLLAYFASLR